MGRTCSGPFSVCEIFGANAVTANAGRSAADRARVFALTGELFGQDPSCIYQPRRGQSANTKRVAQTEAAAKIISQ